MIVSKKFLGNIGLKFSQKYSQELKILRSTTTAQMIIFFITFFDVFMKLDLKKLDLKNFANRKFTSL